MLDNNAKQFGIYLLAQVLHPVSRSAVGPNTVLTQLSILVPGLDVTLFKNSREITLDVWLNQICPKIVDHFEKSFEPGKMRASA